mmetsp:Transcript_3809/g.16691  ORF Transcript_3809/g.16691 Transcript_3809/m.16691 type:complete len:282 (-) Transcript_3809:48-893(-)
MGRHCSIDSADAGVCGSLHVSLLLTGAFPRSSILKKHVLRCVLCGVQFFLPSPWRRKNRLTSGLICLDLSLPLPVGELAGFPIFLLLPILFTLRLRLVLLLRHLLPDSLHRVRPFQLLELVREHGVVRLERAASLLQSLELGAKRDVLGGQGVYPTAELLALSLLPQAAPARALPVGLLPALALQLPLVHPDLAVGFAVGAAAARAASRRSLGGGCLLVPHGGRAVGVGGGVAVGGRVLPFGARAGSVRTHVAGVHELARSAVRVGHGLRLEGCEGASVSF